MAFSHAVTYNLYNVVALEVVAVVAGEVVEVAGLMAVGQEATCAVSFHGFFFLQVWSHFCCASPAAIGFPSSEVGTFAD